MPRFTFSRVTPYKRKKMMDHGIKVLEAQQQLMEYGGPHQFMLAHHNHETDKGKSVSELQEGYISDWHYPKGDRIDYNSGAQYFYHCHREDTDTEEHGHFHLFIRKPGWPKSWRLKNIPEKDLYMENPMTHMGCIALNRHGQPIRLFMVNRWVSHECVFEAEKMQRLVKKYALHVKENHRGQDDAWRAMDQWVENMVHLFMPQLQWLYGQRDVIMANHLKEDANAYMNREIEELGEVNISLESQIGWLTE